LEVAGEFTALGVEDMARRESLDLVADGVQALQLGGKVHGSRSLGGPSDVETADTNRVTCRNNPILLLVIQNPGEHAIKMFGGIETIFHVLYESVSLYHNPLPHCSNHTYQRDDDFAVRVCLIVVFHVQGLPHDAVVVNFTVDGQGEGFIVVNEGLGAGV
jgi:hypothetical protein